MAKRKIMQVAVTAGGPENQTDTLYVLDDQGDVWAVMEPADADTEGWTRLPELPTKVKIAEIAVAAGGEDNETDSLYVLDTQGETWAVMDPMEATTTDWKKLPELPEVD